MFPSITRRSPAHLPLWLRCAFPTIVVVSTPCLSLDHRLLNDCNLLMNLASASIARSRDQDLFVAFPCFVVRGGNESLIRFGAQAGTGLVGVAREFVAGERVFVACRAGCGAEEHAETDLVGDAADERVNDRKVRNDEGDEGLATGPLGAGDGALFSRLIWLAWVIAFSAN